MRETNHQQDSNGNDLDHLLDAALAKYADATPRDGLEDRILANLRAGQERETMRSWWTWGLAAAAVAAVAVLAVAVSLRFGKTEHPVIADRRLATTPTSTHSPIPEAAPENRETTAPLRRVHRTVRRPAQPPNLIADGPKLDQFPSPQPLSEEERALARYVRSFPKEATLIAQRQEQFDLDAQKQMSDDALQNQPSDSVQPER